MGKKNKHKPTDASTSQGKRSKIYSPPPSPVPLPKIKYEDMPLNHKKKFYVNDDCGSLKKYTEIITWLRTMGSFDGSEFKDITNLNWSGEGYPLVEIEVVTPEGLSAKFIIYRMNLYLIAFYAHRQWYQFDSEFEIDNFSMLKSYKGMYTSKPWKHVGPKAMIDAVNLLAVEQDLLDISLSVKACEVFFVHLSEAARLYPVESLVCKSLAPLQIGKFDKRTYEDEEKTILMNEDGKTIEDEYDVYSLVKGDGPVNFNLSVETPDYIEKLIKKYSLMSKVWYVYSLTGGKFFDIRPQNVSILHMRSIKSLRCTLAVLCNINLDKVLDEWKVKSIDHGIVTPEVYKEVEEKVRELQAQKKVLLPKTRDDS